MVDTLKDFTLERIEAVLPHYHIHGIPCPDIFLDALANMHVRNKRNLDQIVHPAYFSAEYAKEVVALVLTLEHGQKALGQQAQSQEQI